MNTAALLIPAFALLASPALAQTVTNAGQVVLGESRLDDEKIGEFSALVRDPDGEGVIAISDRGYLAHLDLTIEDGRLTGVTPVKAFVLTGPDGSMRDQSFDPEGATLLDDGTIAIVSETGPRLAVFDTEGNWLRDEALPEPLQAAAKKDGIESLAWTAEAGFIAMTEEPQQGPRHVHTLHSTKAGSTSFASTGDSVSVKGMEAVGDRLFILERTRNKDADTMTPFLRIMEPATCLGQEDCATVQLPIPVDGIQDADFEGLAGLDDNTFLMVSDDKIDKDLRSVFVMFRVE